MTKAELIIEVATEAKITTAAAAMPQLKDLETSGARAGQKKTPTQGQRSTDRTAARLLRFPDPMF